MINAYFFFHYFSNGICSKLLYLSLQDGTKCTYMTVLLQGQCMGKGTFDEMSTSGIDFASLLQTNEEEEEKEKKPVVVYKRAASVDHSHSSLQNTGSTSSLTSIGTEFEVHVRS